MIGGFQTAGPQTFLTTRTRVWGYPDLLKHPPTAFQIQTVSLFDPMRTRLLFIIVCFV